MGLESPAPVRHVEACYAPVTALIFDPQSRFSVLHLVSRCSRFVDFYSFFVMVQCYYKHNGLIETINSGLCSGSGSAAGFYSCCFPWDGCLPNALCASANQTGYYTGLCTDQTLKDSACQQGCSTKPDFFVAHTRTNTDYLQIRNISPGSGTTLLATYGPVAMMETKGAPLRTTRPSQHLRPRCF